MTQIAFVAYPGVTALDVVGPYEVLRTCRTPRCGSCGSGAGARPRIG